MFVGTIHSYCFDLLTRSTCPKYEMFDVLDEHRLTAFLTREAYTIGLPQLDSRNRLFAGDPRLPYQPRGNRERAARARTTSRIRSAGCTSATTTLADNRFLTYGQLIAHAVKAARGSRGRTRMSTARYDI